MKPQKFESPQWQELQLLRAFYVAEDPVHSEPEFREEALTKARGNLAAFYRKHTGIRAKLVRLRP